MPPRWSRKPDRNDPDYRRLDDRMNFAVHVAIFAATNSGLWFGHLFQNQAWPWVVWVTGIWAIALVAHGVYIFAIAQYPQPKSSSQSKGFAKPKSSS
ncbi:MAG: 2TM domain-containing protein [Elainellaceae cyanobacterium]